MLHKREQPSMAQYRFFLHGAHECQDIFCRLQVVKDLLFNRSIVSQSQVARAKAGTDNAEAAPMES